ncbi:MAG TPA: carboxypeptidase-like regulatory domain-containing protein, partial [Vicinamibacteria bacterium]|nr:carboxypeptidase-like regulatory domain-containing protein [Vicinamibacteria bacterium]
MVLRGVKAGFATIFFLLLAAPVMAQDWTGRGRLQGTVLDPDGKPVEKAKVTLTFGDKQTGPPPAYSDSKGRWATLGLTQGTWKVHIEKDSYQLSEG